MLLLKSQSRLDIQVLTIPIQWRYHYNIRFLRDSPPLLVVSTIEEVEIRLVLYILTDAYQQPSQGWIFYRTDLFR